MKQIIVNIVVLIVVMIVAAPFYAHAQLNWIYRYNGPGNNSDEALSLDYGSDGNIYVAGYSSSDFTVMSFAPIGDTNWVYRYDGSSSEYGRAYDLDFGADSNIYVAGYLWDGVSSRDFAVISLAMSGDENWVYRYGYNNYALASVVVHGADGNIYAAGRVNYASTGDDFTVISLTDSGDTRWIYRYASPENNEGAYSIVYGLDGNIYAAGGIGYDFAVVSLTSTGDTNWVYRYDNWDWEQAVSIVYGADGNIYAAGHSESGYDNRDFLVISLTTSGNENWIFEYDGGCHDIDAANAVVYGKDNNIYAAGYVTLDTDMLCDFTVIKLNTVGSVKWVHRYDGMGTPWRDDEAKSIVFGSDWNIYAVGYSRGAGSHDYLVMSLTTSGYRRWVYRYNGSGNGSDIARSIDCGADNNIYVAGGSTGAGTGLDMTVISLGQAGIISEKETEYTLCSNYVNVSPNPFSRIARFEFCISPLHTPTSLYLYDISGRVQDIIWQESNQLPKSFVYQPATHITSGIYYLVLDVAGVRYVRRVVLVR